MTRRTQSERSASTRSALVDAAITLLMERGWHAATAVAVCETAGVTRGALTHHYLDLGELLAEALEFVLDELASRNTEAPTTVRATIDMIWRAVSTSRFKVVLEAWWAAGDDSELAADLAPVIAKFAKVVSPENAHEPKLRESEAKVFVLTAREAMLGLAMGRAIAGGRALPHERTVLSALRSQADEIDTRIGTTSVPPTMERARR
jgi:AcrR family transcriptional regulator